MSKYDADEWDMVTDYGWQLDMRRVIDDIDARLDALEARMTKGDGEYLHLDNLYDKLSQRLDALEAAKAAQVPSEKERRMYSDELLDYSFKTIKERLTNLEIAFAKLLDELGTALAVSPSNFTLWSTDKLLYEMLLIGADQSEYAGIGVREEIERRLAQAKQDAPAVAPQPETTGETPTILFTLSPGGFKIEATPDEIRNAAMALGMVDQTPRMKVALAFLHAALHRYGESGENTYRYLAYYLQDTASSIWSTSFSEAMRSMAAVLESASKDGAE